MHLIDQLLLLAFLIATLVIGLRRGQAQDGEERVDYVLAGRRLTIGPFVATMVSTWYGGILGVGEYTWRYGLSSWLVFGVPYYIAAAIFAVFIARRARESNASTLPEQLEVAYGPWPRRLGGAVVFLTTLPAAYLLTLGVLLEIAFGVPLVWGLAVSAIFSVVYLWRSGFAAVTRTDTLQFILMFVGFAMLLAFLVVGYGGPSFLLKNTPETHWVWHGGNAPQAIFVWYIIALSTLVEPTFYQRCFAATTPAVAKRGLLLSICCWLVFDAMTTACGLYGRALLKGMTKADAAQVFPLLAEQVLPIGLVGIFFMSLFAVVMSTVDSYLFVSASTIGRDFLERTRRFKDRPQAATRIGLILAAILTLALALTSRSVVKLWHALGTVGVCTLLIPTVAAFTQRARMSSRGALTLMLLALPLSTVWLLVGRLSADGVFPLGVEPIYPGLGLGVIVWGIDRGVMARASRKGSP